MRKNQAVARTVAVAASAVLAAAVAQRRGRSAFAACLAVASASLTWAAYFPRSRLLGPVVWRGPASGGRMALTFDDGPSESTPAILDALAACGAKATFFVLGRQARRYPEIIARMKAEGHQVANHGDDHGILIFRGPGYVRRQLDACRDAVEAAAGPGSMSDLFRAPHGFRGPWTWFAARRAGYRMAGWTKGVFDSAEPGADVIVERCNAAMRPGSVLLLHDADGWDPDRARPQTAEAVPNICTRAFERGLELVTMAELMRTTT